MSNIKPQTTQNTLVDYPRLNVLLQQLEATKNIPGIITEVGVYKGGTAFLLCDNANGKAVVLCDTFQGMPKVDSGKDLHHEGDFADTSIEGVRKLLGPFSNFITIKGIFPEDNPNILDNEVFSLVHLDCDIYPSVKNCLNYFYSKMSVGGVIVLDDYNEPNCPGAKQATDEFLLGKPEKLIITTQSQAMFVKL